MQLFNVTRIHHRIGKVGAGGPAKCRLKKMGTDKKLYAETRTASEAEKGSPVSNQCWYAMFACLAIKKVNRR
jgi:hypothetical protein